MAYITRTVNPQDVVELLVKEHQLDPGMAVGRTDVDFAESSGGRQEVKVTFTYVLSTGQVDRLLNL